MTSLPSERSALLATGISGSSTTGSSPILSRNTRTWSLSYAGAQPMKWNSLKPLQTVPDFGLDLGALILRWFVARVYCETNVPVND